MGQWENICIKLHVFTQLLETVSIMIIILNGKEGKRGLLYNHIRLSGGKELFRNHDHV